MRAAATLVVLSALDAAALRPTRVTTRRAALRGLAASSLPLAFSFGEPARAACSCPTGMDSCTCTEDKPAVSSNQRVRYGTQGTPQPSEFSGSGQWKRVEAGSAGPALQSGSAREDVTREEARQRFADVLAQRVAKREKDLGFTLDADDIKELEGILRIKYCGPDGLIGPC